MKKCPYCAEEIQDAAIVCKYCGRDINAEKTKPKINQTESKKNIPTWLIIAVIVIMAIVSFYAISDDNSGGGNAGSVKSGSVKFCWVVTVTKCEIRSPDRPIGAVVYGTVKNNCDTKLNSVEVVSEVYSSNGTMLSSDPEYVKNLQPGEQGTFEALMDSPASQGKTCKAHISQGY